MDEIYHRFLLFIKLRRVFVKEKSRLPLNSLYQHTIFQIRKIQIPIKSFQIGTFLIHLGRAKASEGEGFGLKLSGNRKMKRVFGVKKDKAPPPSLQDATDTVNLSPPFSPFCCRIFCYDFRFSFFLSRSSATKRRVVGSCCLMVRVCIDFK